MLLAAVPPVSSFEDGLNSVRYEDLACKVVDGHSALQQRRWDLVRRTFGLRMSTAESTFDSGKRLVEKYLTAWRNQADGSWKIRNIGDC